MRPAGRDDLPTLLAMMDEFHAESGCALDRRAACASFEALLSDPRLGCVWLVPDEGEAAGYVVVTFAFTMEHGGMLAIADDFYVRPARRRRGLGTAALAHVRRECVARGVRAMRVEVGPGNPAAQALYRRNGFAAVDHILMTATLVETAGDPSGA